MARTASEADIETRRKRLLYRSIYRGNKENDILLGQFARAHIASLDAAELDQYERLLEAGCKVLMPWCAPIGAAMGAPIDPLLAAIR